MFKNSLVRTYWGVLLLTIGYSFVIVLLGLSAVEYCLVDVRMVWTGSSVTGSNYVPYQMLTAAETKDTSVLGFTSIFLFKSHYIRVFVALIVFLMLSEIHSMSLHGLTTLVLILCLVIRLGIFIVKLFVYIDCKNFWSCRLYEKQTEVSTLFAAIDAPLFAILLIWKMLITPEVLSVLSREENIQMRILRLV